MNTTPAPTVAPMSEARTLDDPPYLVRIADKVRTLAAVKPALVRLLEWQLDAQSVSRICGAFLLCAAVVSVGCSGKSNPEERSDPTVRDIKDVASFFSGHSRFGMSPDVFDDKGKLKEAGEERRLLDATVKNPGMQRLIIAALETGCRRGELLALTWADVNLERREMRIRGETAKDSDTRILPISTRLAGVLDMAKLDPAGKEYPLTAHIFGEVGEPIASTKRAWETAVLKAHGFKPVWQSGTLAPASRAKLKEIDLHFHDLRHEAGSRLLEAGWPIHHVKEMLGHAKISQTDTYLNAGKMGLHDSMKRFAHVRRNPVAIEQESEQPLDGDKEKQEAPKMLVN